MDQLFRGSGLAELIPHTYPVHLRRALLYKTLSDCAAETADDIVLFSSYNSAGLCGTLYDQFLIQRLDGADIDDFRSISAASRADATQRPVAIILTSLPSRITLPLPIRKS